MRAAEFFRAVTMDKSDLLTRILDLFARENIRYCVIGGLAVNAYVEPAVTLDLDVVIAPEQVDRLTALLSAEFDVTDFPHSLYVTDPNSKLRVQVQKDDRYNAFIAPAEMHEVLEVPMRVAAVEDVLQGKIWAASDPERRDSKRKKDIADIARIVESYPHLRDRVPPSLR